VYTTCVLFFFSFLGINTATYLLNHSGCATTTRSEVLLLLISALKLFEGVKS
jgi:hypothetical protein